MAKAVADVNEEIQGGFASNDADSRIMRYIFYSASY